MQISTAPEVNSNQPPGQVLKDAVMRHELFLKQYESATCHLWTMQVSGRVLPGSDPHVVHGDILCPGSGPSVEDVRIDDVFEVADFGIVHDQGFRLNFIEVDGGEEKLIKALLSSAVDVESIGKLILTDWQERKS